MKVYAINNPLKDYQTTKFLVFREEPSRIDKEDGEFVWVDSHFYMPVE
ncbi:hypothetical protein B0H99_103171 [Planomicrobium soli]|uniref:Uncharacterized protein n=1 Tax=Planomicrobium soli TaxID=1176648 RepID=A0A2P8H495_9BACL|nr:hypothetical protein [Planomicrobium soli]PSL41037.1 hypothetical protein B0H99_103171 [Planomicrobium soli]